jgi:hypothetical protein
MGEGASSPAEAKAEEQKYASFQKRRHFLPLSTTDLNPRLLHAKALFIYYATMLLALNRLFRPILELVSGTISKIFEVEIARNLVATASDNGGHSVLNSDARQL